MRIELLAVLPFLIMGCNSSTKNYHTMEDEEQQNTASMALEDDSWDDRAGWADLTKTDSIQREKQRLNDSLFNANTSFLNSTLIIQPKAYHGDEIPLSYANVNWSGIISTDSGTYFAPINMRIEQINDPIIDDPDQKTGKKVVIDSLYQCDFLIYGLDSLKGRIAVPDTFQSHLLPNDSLYLSEDVYIFATGNRNGNDPESIYGITNYGIHVASPNGSHQLFYSKGFDDTFVELLWMGDLNHDGLFDLIIDTSDHYNRTSPTLYLSLAPGKHRIMEQITIMESIGC